MKISLISYIIKYNLLPLDISNSKSLISNKTFVSSLIRRYVRHFFKVNTKRTAELFKKTKNSKIKEYQNNAPAGNRTRVCTVAGYYSTTRPLVLVG